MNILFLAHRNPWPPQKGTQVRPFQMALHLARRGHQVHLAAFLDEGDALGSIEALSRYFSSATLVPLNNLTGKLRAGVALLGGQSLSSAYFFSSGMRQQVARIMAEHHIDTATGFSSTMAQYVPDSLRHRCVFDLCDLDSEKWLGYAARASIFKAWLYSTEARRLSKVEFKCMQTFGACSLASERERALLANHRFQSMGLDDQILNKVFVAPNGTDLDYFSPPATNTGRLPGRIVFTGAMDYKPNIEAVIWLVEEVLPRLRAKRQGVSLTIVGSKPTPAVQALTQHPDVIVTGYVDDVRPWIHQASLAVVPLHLARGIQNKALEALACACPTVMTSACAEGLERPLGDEAPFAIADTADEFAETCHSLLSDPEQSKKMGIAARTYIEAHYAWAARMDPYVDQLETVGKGE